MAKAGLTKDATFRGLDAPIGKASIKVQTDSTNAFPGRKNHDSTPQVKIKPYQKPYAGKNATSTGFVTTRAREFK